ncbi:MAG: DUF433 domain-containing protein [Candidatus Latescibacterota bacterium]
MRAGSTSHGGILPVDNRAPHALGTPWPPCRGSDDLNDSALLRRVTADPRIFGGKPIIRGMRISVELILSLLAQGVTADEILADYPDPQPEDIRACLACAHAVIARDTLDAVQVAGTRGL